jgi:hypothetical protein
VGKALFVHPRWVQVDDVPPPITRNYVTRYWLADTVLNAAPAPTTAELRPTQRLPATASTE